MTQLSCGFSRSILAIAASVNSAGVTAPLATSSACATASSEVNSLLLILRLLLAEIAPCPYLPARRREKLTPPPLPQRHRRSWASRACPRAPEKVQPSRAPDTRRGMRVARPATRRSRQRDDSRRRKPALPADAPGESGGARRADWWRQLSRWPLRCSPSC